MKVLIARLDESKKIGETRSDMVDIEGVPLLDRTIEQCKVAGFDPVILPMEHRWLAKVLADRSVEGAFVCLRGDTFYSDSVLRSMVNIDEHRWVGRSGMSWLSGHGAEVFGFTWPDDDTSNLDAALKATVEHAEMSSSSFDRFKTAVGGLWQPYRLIMGNGIDVHGFDQKLWFDVADFTESFVNAGVYQRWSHSRENRWFCQQPVSLGDYNLPPGVGPVE